MKRALITGISGFVGGHLEYYLRKRGWKVYGFDRHVTGRQENVYTGDIANRDEFKKILLECRPDFVFHLAGIIKSHQPEMLYNANLLGTVALFENLLDLNSKATVLVASSSAIYGSGFGGRLINEKFKPRPMTHYGTSKLAQEIAALRYFDAFRLPVMIVRMFNLLGPGQSPDLACSAFARQIALAEIHGNDEIVTGELNARRDFVDVRDAVHAFGLIAEIGKAGQVYNVCSERAIPVRKCLDEMLSLSLRLLQVRVAAERVQKNDVPVQVGSAQKLRSTTGWRPQISLKQSLSDLLDYWRQRAKLGLE